MPVAALKLAVIGDPVAHSASPELQRGFLIATGIAGTYDAIRIVAGDGARGIGTLRDAGYTGLNVTTPLKEEAYAYVDERDATARAAAAVNTIVFSGPRALGYNTDGIGAVGALHDAGLDRLRGTRVLVLGAGPTARAAVLALVAGGADTLVWNRTREKAERVTRSFGAAMWDESVDRVDAVFATLSPGVTIGDRALFETIAKARIVVDANYADRSTLGAMIGRDVTTGSAMLRASARASFELFCGGSTAQSGDGISHVDPSA